VEPETAEEKEIYEDVAKVMDMAPDILDSLFNYTGCEEFIRKVNKFFFVFIQSKFAVLIVFFFFFVRRRLQILGRKQWTLHGKR